MGSQFVSETTETFYPSQNNFEIKTSKNIFKPKPISKAESNFVRKRSWKCKFGTVRDVELALKKQYTLNINVPSYWPRPKSEENQQIYDYPNYEIKIDKCNMAQQNCSRENSQSHQLFEYPDEYLYKEFPATSGHMKGDNEQISVLLSSHALYLIHPSEVKLKFMIPYEHVEVIIIGSFARWLAIRKKITLDNFNVSEESCDVIVEMVETRIVMDFIKYFEIAIRRRLQTLYLSERWIDNSYGAANKHMSMLRKRIDKPNLSLSIGQLIDHFIPSVISSFPKEIEYIERSLAKQNDMKVVKVVRCCLVFWENGSMAVCDEGDSRDFGPHIEGHLMVHLHNLKTWVPAYFILKGSVLYQFTESTDPLPYSILELSGCCGCSRITSELRPYGFQIIRGNDSPILLAAPNEQTASRWLQIILKCLCHKEDTEKRKFLPCQLIQTTSGLALTHQEDICKLVIPSTKSAAFNITAGKSVVSLEKRIVNISLCDRSKNSRHLNNPIKQEKLKSFKNDDCPKYDDIITLSDKELKVSISDEMATSCPPTPPPLHIPASSSSPQDNTLILKILSFNNYNQISEILVDLKAKAVFVEFECSEASELALDWALYFTSENHLNNFISNIQAVSEISITYSTSGQISDFLRGGALYIYRRNKVKLLFS